jgi:hypothetical protein
VKPTKETLERHGPELYGALRDYRDACKDYRVPDAGAAWQRVDALLSRLESPPEPCRHDGVIVASHWNEERSMVEGVLFWCPGCTPATVLSWEDLSKILRAHLLGQSPHAASEGEIKALVERLLSFGGGSYSLDRKCLEEEFTKALREWLSERASPHAGAADELEKMAGVIESTQGSAVTTPYNDGYWDGRRDAIFRIRQRASELRAKAPESAP